MTVSVSVGYVEIEGKGELVGRGTGRIHVVRLAEVVAGVRRTSKKRRGGRIDVGAAGVNEEKSCFPKGEEKQGPETDSDRDTDAATADSGENEVRRRNMRECEDAMMEDTASRHGYAPTAAWDPTPPQPLCCTLASGCAPPRGWHGRTSCGSAITRQRHLAPPSRWRSQ